MRESSLEVHKYHEPHSEFTPAQMAGIAHVGTTNFSTTKVQAPMPHLVLIDQVPGAPSIRVRGNALKQHLRGRVQQRPCASSKGKRPYPTLKKP